MVNPDEIGSWHGMLSSRSGAWSGRRIVPFPLNSIGGTGTHPSIGRYFLPSAYAHAPTSVPANREDRDRAMHFLVDSVALSGMKLTGETMQKSIGRVDDASSHLLREMP
jgi:hypothetical protein